MGVEQQAQSDSLSFCAALTQRSCATLTAPRRRPGPRFGVLSMAPEPLGRHCSWTPAFAGEQRSNRNGPSSTLAKRPYLLGKPPIPKRKRGPALLPGPVSPDFCRGPGRIFGMVSAAPRPAPARASELRFGRRGWPFSTHPEGALRLPASAARFVSPAGTGNRKPRSDAFSPLDPLRPSASLARRFRLAKSPGGPFLRARIRSLARPSPRTRVRTLSVSPVRIRPCLRTAFRIRFGPALACRPPLALPSALACHLPRSPPAALACCSRLPRRILLAQSASFPGRSGLRRPSKSLQRLGGTSISKLPRLRIPEPFPNAVSRRHLHRFRPV